MPIPTKIVGFQSGHDVCYCILENGIPVLCEELERFSRVKWQLDDGLKFFFGRLNPEKNIKYFTFGNLGNREESGLFKDKASDITMKSILKKNDGKYYEFGHHVSHAANAFFTSNFDEALIITMDAGGQEDDKTETAFTISRGADNKIERITTFPFSDLNLGSIWNRATEDIFGLSIGFPKGHQAGTVMAMATLGRPVYSSLFRDLSKNAKKLKSIANFSEQEKFNVAASLQEYTEKTFKQVVSKYMIGQKYVCLSGGVSLNCVLAGKIKKWFPKVQGVFCDPVPYDAGTALGSARYLWHQILGNPRIHTLRNMSPYLGKTYNEDEIRNAITQFGDKLKLNKTNDGKVLKEINNQKIIAVYGGGSETGRRALGNRSILADPRNKMMKEKINSEVKHREWFRPLAPSILEERVTDWFEGSILSPFMSFAINVRDNKKDKVPAVVHFDGTARLQTVNRDLNHWFHDFLSKWENLTGVPMLINTSFNDNEPIVESPEDAIICFLNTNIDYLYFFDYGILVEKI